MPETINVRPSARILRVLGDIEFDNWQCIAELVDNAFDDFLEIQREGLAWPDGFKVSVTLPGRQASARDAEIIVEDSGRGMDLQTLNNAVRAGWSSNDQFSKLGLFGMGFNVATARLGKVARVLTTRSGDLDWTGVEIDLDTIGDDFEVEVIHEPKTDIQSHGTKVIVRRMDPSRAGWFQTYQPALRTTLGNIYSYLLDHQQFELLVQGVMVKPRRPCRWDESRSVTFGTGVNAEQIPAYIPIDNLLPPANNCLRCRRWQPIGDEVCSECGSTELVQRVRHVHGWLGIQRYLHKTDFGIDFFRNGRKILRYDKRLFEWENPDNPLAPTEIEYPTELGQGGRIIGEIHLDHVPVNYQKDAFEWSDRNWRAAVEMLRGTGPLLPRRAEQVGAGYNTSPLARLHRGYRRNDPGYRYLIPGDENGPIHEETRRWAQKFDDGDPEYQTDQKWWDAVVSYEEHKAAKEALKNGPALPELPGGIYQALGLEKKEFEAAPEENEAPVTQPPPLVPTIETEQERLDRYRAHGRELPGLTGEFGLVEFGAAVKVQTYYVTGCEVQNNAGNRTPVLLTPGPGNTYAAFVDATHPVFKDFADDAADFVMLELANQLRVRAGRSAPDFALGEVVAMLKERHLSDHKVDPASLAGQARELLRTVQERMADAVRDNPERAWQFLNPDERVATENNLVTESAAVTLQQCRESGDFLLYTPPMFLPRLIEEWPSAFMDGRVFIALYEAIASPAGKRLSVSKIVSYLYDVIRLATVMQLPKTELIRARLSVELLPAELAQEPSD